MSTQDTGSFAPLNLVRTSVSGTVAIEVSNQAGMKIGLSNRGAALRSCVWNGRELTLGYTDEASYEHNASFFATTVGRYANRIARGKFAIDGQSFQLECNDPPNHLHGGPHGFDSRLWECVPVRADVTAIDGLSRTPAAGALFSLDSPDGDQGFPGAVHAEVLILLSADNQVILSYRATSDAPTLVNLTNHSYWNLEGKGTVHRHSLALSCLGWWNVDSGSIPTGVFKEMPGSAWDFTRERELGPVLSDPEARTHAGFTKGLDHCFLLKPVVPANFAVQVEGPSGKSLDFGGALRPAGRVAAPDSPSMEVLSSLAGVQIYTANYLDDLPARGGTAPMHGAICLETGLFPDSPNQAARFREEGESRAWPKAETATWDSHLVPGQVYRALTVHRFRS